MLTNLICTHWAIKETQKFEPLLKYKIYAKPPITISMIWKSSYFPSSRTPKASARYYKKIVTANGFMPEDGPCLWSIAELKAIQWLKHRLSQFIDGIDTSLERIWVNEEYTHTQQNTIHQTKPQKTGCLSMLLQSVGNFVIELTAKEWRHVARSLQSQSHHVTLSQDQSDQKEVRNTIWSAKPFDMSPAPKLPLRSIFFFGWVDTGICGLRGGLILYKMRLFNWTSNLSGWADWSRKSRSRKLI